ncbi:MAG: hypothetical protein IKF60_10445 [Solobacterium sp.]|nr:hypothetical protein [Solobacterium sp.]
MKLISQAGCAMLLASFLLLFGCGTVDTSVDDTPDELPISDFLSMDFSVWNLNPPKEIQYVRQEEASEEVTITDPETIRNVIQALQNITVGEEERMRYTDSDAFITFVFPEDKQITVSFEHGNLMIGDKLYKAGNTGPLFTILNEALEATYETNG